MSATAPDTPPSLATRNSRACRARPFPSQESRKPIGTLSHVSRLKESRAAARERRVADYLTPPEAAPPGMTTGTVFRPPPPRVGPGPGFARARGSAPGPEIFDARETFERERADARGDARVEGYGSGPNPLPEGYGLEPNPSPEASETYAPAPAPAPAPSSARLDPPRDAKPLSAFGKSPVAPPPSLIAAMDARRDAAVTANDANVSTNDANVSTNVSTSASSFASDHRASSFASDPLHAPSRPSPPAHLVPVSEVAALVAAAIAGEPPRLLGTAKGAAAAALASVSETVRRAVTDARREGAGMGASEARLALQRSSAKAERAARAAVEAAEETARAAEEKRRTAEERRRAAEEALAAKSRGFGKRMDETKEALSERCRALKARADAAVNETAATRAELKRERERAEAAAKAAAEATYKENLAKARAEANRLREEANRLREDARRDASNAASERRRADVERANVVDAFEESRRHAAESFACLREEATRAAADAASDAAEMRREFDETRKMLSEASSAVAARHRAQLRAGLRREAALRERLANVEKEFREKEREEEREKEREKEQEKEREEVEKALEEELARRTAAEAKFAKYDDSLVVARRERDDARRERDAASEVTSTLRMELACASSATKAAEAEAAAAWRAAAEAEADVEAAAERRARALAETIRSTRRRYFADGRGGTARLDVEGLVEALLDFKRRDADALAEATREGGADDDARRELRALEECVLVTLSNANVTRDAGSDAGPEPCESPATTPATRRSRRGVPGKDSPKLTMSDEDVLEMLNL